MSSQPEPIFSPDTVDRFENSDLIAEIRPANDDHPSRRELLLVTPGMDAQGVEHIESLVFRLAGDLIGMLAKDNDPEHKLIERAVNAAYRIIHQDFWERYGQRVTNLRELVDTEHHHGVTKQ
jgi:hypothetical protein